MKTEFYIRQENWVDRISIRIREGNHHVVELVWKEIAIGSITDPALVLEIDEAQELMDQLYACGIRPSESKGSAGQLTAIQYHLEDMRKLVFK